MDAVVKLLRLLPDVLSDGMMPPVHVRLVKTLVEDARNKLNAWQAKSSAVRKRIEMEGHASLLHAKQLKDFLSLITGISNANAVHQLSK
jgi:hypothetical protein